MIFHFITRGIFIKHGYICFYNSTFLLRLNNCIKHTVKQGKEKKRTEMDMDIDIDGESLTHEVKMHNSNRNPKQGYRINTRVFHNVRRGLNHFKVKVDTNERTSRASYDSIDRSINRGSQYVYCTSKIE